MVPLEKTLEKPASDSDRRPRRRPRPAQKPHPPKPRAAAPRSHKSTPLPPGHVRKKTTGEIGKVRSVDPKAGTAEVFWLRRGDASTVPLSAISRR